LRSKLKEVTGNENVKKSFFANNYLRQKRIVFVKPRPKDQRPYRTHIVDYISPAKMLRFVIICNTCNVCNYPGGPCTIIIEFEMHQSVLRSAPRWWLMAVVIS